MGAGTAVMLTMMLRDMCPELSSARCVAIACPACMTEDLARSCTSYVTSIVNSTDIVPTFCSGEHPYIILSFVPCIVCARGPNMFS